jgi:cytochrome c oxidase assembly factor CtaG
LDLTALYLLGLPAFLYVRALRILRRRGLRVPVWQQAAWFGGLALIGVALLSPLDDLGDTDLVSAHMAQHLLIGDLSAPLILIGLRWPVYPFLLPRAMAAAIGSSKPIRKIFRFLKFPLVAAGLWILILYGWHVAPAYEAALRNPVLHAFQHQTFVIGSLLVWVSVLEPNRARVPGGLWKIAHITGVRFAGMFLGMAFVIVSHPFYSGFYGDRALQHGLTPDQDQGIAGGMMLGVDFLVMIGALIFFFLRSATDAEAEQRAEELAAAERPHLSQPVPIRETGVGLG